MLSQKKRQPKTFNKAFPIVLFLFITFGEKMSLLYIIIQFFKDTSSHFILRFHLNNFFILIFG